MSEHGKAKNKKQEERKIDAGADLLLGGLHTRRNF